MYFLCNFVCSFPMPYESSWRLVSDCLNSYLWCLCARELLRQHVRSVFKVVLLSHDLNLNWLSENQSPLRMRTSRLDAFSYKYRSVHSHRSRFWWVTRQRWLSNVRLCYMTYEFFEWPIKPMLVLFHWCQVFQEQLWKISQRRSFGFRMLCTGSFVMIISVISVDACILLHAYFVYTMWNKWKWIDFWRPLGYSHVLMSGFL